MSTFIGWIENYDPIGSSPVTESEEVPILAILAERRFVAEIGARQTDIRPEMHALPMTDPIVDADA